MFIEFGAHALVVFEDVAKLQGLADGDVQFINVERFGDIVERPVAHRLHGVFHGAVGRHDNHRQVRKSAFDFCQQLRTVHAGHAPVADDQVDVFGLQHFQGVQAIARSEHRDAILIQRRRQQVTELGLVVDHQYVMCHRYPRRTHHPWPVGKG
ncbi:hypothetical protein D3C80_1597920 [compost metagenome]